MMLRNDGEFLGRTRRVFIGGYPVGGPATDLGGSLCLVGNVRREASCQLRLHCGQEGLMRWACRGGRSGCGAGGCRRPTDITTDGVSS